ncbi:MAG: NADPH-dependent 7-cyano-7-deazaguanine reductase QueF [Candidatus Fermentibacteraceae bacterium]|nr:NADPH-dependent 7-cyano-7-deazaguanine reductase QueF [Candidatus Fermentibacteraceae bacterium]
MTDDASGLSLLGNSTDEFEGLEAFENLNPERDYTVTLATDEFTCVCPKTGQPDFATVTITYIPDKRILESKSLKLYFQTYRNTGVFHEHVTNIILNDLVEAIHPRWCRVQADFGVRGGISITVEAEYTGNQD